MSDFPPEWRRMMTEQFIAIGAPRNEASEIVDLAVHASEQAIETLLRVSGNSGADLGMSVLPLALQLLNHQASIGYQQVREQMEGWTDVETNHVDITLSPMAA